jgi:hypothetical protein
MRDGLLARIVRAREVRRQVAQDMMRRANVVACGVGFKMRSAQQTSEPSVIVSVTQKQPLPNLSPDDLIPPEIEDVLTDVVQTGIIHAYSVNRRGRVRPVRPGVSISHAMGTAGTLGCVVQRDGELFLVSNNHILAMLNQANIGDPILQPGPSDGGTLDDQVAELEAFVPLHFLVEEPEPSQPTTEPEPEPEPAGCSAALARTLNAISQTFGGKSGVAPTGLTPQALAENTADAALARPIRPELIDASIVEVGIPGGIASPQLHGTVVKSGRTTGLTSGQVLQMDVMIDVQYPTGKVRFVDQIVTTPMSRPGDSGSPVLDRERRIIGLIFSGSDQASVISPIDNILTALGVELVSGPG